jgi:hypothetical protein
MFSPEWNPSSKPLFSFDSPKAASKASSAAAEDLEQEQKASFWDDEFSVFPRPLEHQDTFTSHSSLGVDDEKFKKESSVEGDSFWKRHGIDSAEAALPPEEDWLDLGKEEAPVDHKDSKEEDASTPNWTEEDTVAWFQKSMHNIVFPEKKSDSSSSSHRASPVPSGLKEVKTEQPTWEDFALHHEGTLETNQEPPPDTRLGVSLFNIYKKTPPPIEAEKEFEWDNGSSSPVSTTAGQHYASSAASPASDRDKWQYAADLASPAPTDYASPAFEPAQSRKRKRKKESNPEVDQKKAERERKNAELERIRQAVLEDYRNGITSPAELNKKHPGTNATNIGRWLDKADPERVKQRQPKPRKKTKKSLIVTLHLKKKEQPKQTTPEPTHNQFNVFDTSMTSLSEQQQLAHEEASIASPGKTGEPPKKKYRLLVSK